MEIQKIYSDIYDDERLYSVLMSEDEMALYQAIFSDDEEDEEMEEAPKGRGKKIAAGVAGGTAVGTGAIVGGKYAGRHLRAKGSDLSRRVSNAVTKGQLIAEDEQILRKQAGRNIKIGKALEKPADVIVKGKNAAVNAGRNAARWVGKNKGKSALIAAGVTAAGAGTAYGAKKLRDRKRNND